MGRRHLTITAVAAGIGTALTLALGPYTTSGASSTSHFHSSATTATAFAPTGAVRPDGTPYAVGGAGCLLVGAALVVARRRAQS